MSPYVDNGNFIGTTKSSVDFTFNRVVEDLEGLGLICHERVDVQDSLLLVGIVFDGSSRTLRHTSRRMWRLHLGMQQLLKRQRASGHIVRVLIGRIVHAFELLRQCTYVPFEVRLCLRHRTSPRVCRDLAIHPSRAVGCFLVFLSGRGSAWGQFQR